jgi:hypothetical protein
MASELDQLLAALDSDTAAGDAALSPPWRYAGMISTMIGPPVPEYATVTARGKAVKVMTDESRKLARAYRGMRWPVLSPRTPAEAEEAVIIWSRHALECMERQRDMVPAKSAPNTAEPADDGGMTSRPIVVRR